MISVAGYLAALVASFVLYIGIRHSFVPRHRKPHADIAYLFLCLGYTLATHTVLAFVLVLLGFVGNYVYYGKSRSPSA